MARFKNTILASATIFAALGTGFVMQSSPVAEMRYGAQTAKTTTSPSLTAEPVYSGVNPFSGVTSLELTSIAYTSAPVQRAMTPDVALVLPQSAFELSDVDMSRNENAPEVFVRASNPSDLSGNVATCSATLDARPMAAAMVNLALTAPCEANNRVTLHHNGMMITEQMDRNGKLTLQMPALSETAIFMAAFETGLTAIAKADVTTLDIYDRVVIQWQGPGQMEIHALEFGADYGDAGHVWSEAPRNMEVAVHGKGGFMTFHGRAMPDQDLRAQVYTFPSGTAAQTGEIVLTVETEVTAENCGRLLEGQSLQITGGGALSVRDLTLDIPTCDATGSFLVLKNLLQDLKIARN